MSERRLISPTRNKYANSRMAQAVFSESIPDEKLAASRKTKRPGLRCPAAICDQTPSASESIYFRFDIG
jgi:hypothetical protein